MKKTCRNLKWPPTCEVKTLMAIKLSSFGSCFTLTWTKHSTFFLRVFDLTPAAALVWTIQLKTGEKAKAKVGEMQANVKGRLKSIPSC